MKVTLVLSLLVPTLAIAAPDEAVVREMAKRTGLSPADIRSSYDACDSGVTLPMKVCASYRWTREDIRLTTAYEQAKVKAKEAGFEASLIAAQDAWQVYRDAACTYEGQMGADGGAYEGLYVLSCKEQLTKERADRLATATRQSGQ
ncbi:lysozyme inhibitor LprI family protein [Ralstonia pseudosolanacearum]|uniref:lysozyme inhibitor LprI family protein n=1 Tax=Ralstonia pseudosolanacearum TaxID=1310165 RepID=UPI0018A34F5D|nr:lysozyme inhibitor LprI family protein [Ralstonia pseudosolanacearum]BCL93375.1 hypothetical protein MAFF211479_30760 [Ralstonia solanacearum]BCN05942.1 hypothetical protein RPSB_30790 [Ralstonia solanacearum]